MYSDKMALLRDVTLDPSRQVYAEPRGGEKMEEVWGQKEEREYFNLKVSFMTES